MKRGSFHIYARVDQTSTIVVREWDKYKRKTSSTDIKFSGYNWRHFARRKKLFPCLSHTVWWNCASIKIFRDLFNPVNQSKYGNQVISITGDVRNIYTSIARIFSLYIAYQVWVLVCMFHMSKGMLDWRRIASPALLSCFETIRLTFEWRKEVRVTGDTWKSET